MSGWKHQTHMWQQLTLPPKFPSLSVIHSCPSHSHLTPFPVALSMTSHWVMLWAPALHHPNMIQMWKCKLQQQQRLGLAGSQECNPGGFPRFEAPSEERTMPWGLSEEQEWRTLYCLQSSFFGLCMAIFLWCFCVEKRIIATAQSCHPHHAATTLLCSHHVRAKPKSRLSHPHMMITHSHCFLPFRPQQHVIQPTTQPHHLGMVKAVTPGLGRDFQVPSQTKTCSREAGYQQQEILVLWPELKTFL